MNGLFNVDNLVNTLWKINYGGLLIKFGSVLLKLLAIIIIFIIVKGIANRIVLTSFSKISDKKKVSSTRVKTLESLTINIVSYVLIFIFIVTVLQVFGINATAILAGAGVVGLAIGFGAQGLVSDVVTGFFLLLERQMDVGDNVTIGTFSGIVEQVGLRTTHIRGFDGTLHYVPNRVITNLSNHSRGNMKSLINISIPYNQDIDRAQTLIQEAFNTYKKEEPTILEGPTVIAVDPFGGPDSVLRIIAKTVNGEKFTIERKLIILLIETLEENGMATPNIDHLYLDMNHS